MNIPAHEVGKTHRAEKTSTDARGWASRRYDWRFLLPEPPQEETPCAGDTLLLPNSCSGTNERAAGKTRDKEKYSLVAASRQVEKSDGRMLRWGEWTLTRTVARMKSCAQIYLEIDRPALTLSPRLVKRRLVGLGVDDARFYWPKQNASGVEMLMPLGDRRLQHYYLQRLFFGASLSKKVLRFALLLLTRANLFEKVLPGYVVVARQDDMHHPGGDSLTPYLLRELRKAWSTLRTGQPTPEKLQWLLLNGGVSERSKISCPLWLNDDPDPAYVMKFQRDKKHNTRLSAEYRALVELQPYLPTGRTRVPQPCGSLDLGSTRVTIESVVPGKPLVTYLLEHPERHNRTLVEWASLARWLAHLHANSTRPASADEMDSLLFERLRVAEQDFALSPQEISAAQRLYSTTLQLSEESPLHTVYNHNDLGTPNVMTTHRGKFGGVIDWEAGGFGLPATDLIYFLGRFAYVARSERGSDELRGFKEIFFGMGDHGKGALSSSIAKEWLGDYCRHLKISPRWLPVLFGLCWTMHARNEMWQSREHAAYSGEPPRAQATDHFRKCLRFYLENMEKLDIAAGLPTQAESDTP